MAGDGDNNAILIKLGIMENEIKSMAKIMERFGEILEKQVEQDTVIKEARNDINICFDHIRDIQVKGTNVCSNHNAQFARYEQECKARGDLLDFRMSEIEKEIERRFKEYTKILDKISNTAEKMEKSFNATCKAKDEDIKDIVGEEGFLFKLEERINNRFKERNNRMWWLGAFILSPLYAGVVKLIFFT